MTEEEELKNLLNAKLSQGEVPFDEENWEHAEELIDDLRKKKKRRRWVIIFFIGLGAGIAVMVPFALHSYKNNSTINDTKQIQPANENHDRELKRNDSSATSQQKNSTKTAKKTDSIPANAALPESTNNTATPPDIKESKDKIVGTDVPVVLAKRKSTHTSQTNSNESSMGVSPAAASAKTTATKNKTVTLAKNSSGNNEPKTKMSSTVKTDSEPTSSYDSHVTPASVNTKEIQKEKLAATKTVTDSATVVKASKPANKQTQPSQAKSQTDTVQKRNDITTTSKKPGPVSQNNVSAKIDSMQTAMAVKNQEEIQRQAAAKTDSLKKPSEAAAVTKEDSTFKKADTTKPIIPPTILAQQPNKPHIAEKDVLSVEAGTNFVTGWSYGSVTEGRGFNPVAGIGYTRIINQTLSVHTGVLFNTIGYLSSSTYTGSHTNYDFGYTAKDTSITTKELYYITVPLELQYNLDEKNYIGVGGTVSYLITSSGTITTYNQNSFTLSNKQTTAQTGYYNGFNSWNAAVTVLYGRKLTDRFSASLTAYFGLMDIKSNSVFAEQKFERETGLRIMVSYNIFQ